MDTLPDKPKIILTIGHSTRPLDEFIGLLKHYQVMLLADVCTVPRSRKNPQFNRESLPQELEKEGIGYAHMPGLGGLRGSILKESPNMGWRTPGFRNYADYMATREFDDNLERLIELAREARLAIMCAEALPWRCHRSLISDALTVRGIEVRHIMSPRSCLAHTLTSWARVEGTRLTYPAPQTEGE
jgi:uncharacterized protein (DUF488 family)